MLIFLYLWRPNIGFLKLNSTLPQQVELLSSKKYFEHSGKDRLHNRKCTTVVQDKKMKVHTIVLKMEL